MAKNKQFKEEKAKEQKNKNEANICDDIKCPFHGELSLRGRVFRGIVTKKFAKRIVISFERTIYIKKFERFAKIRTKLHARLPDCLNEVINVGDYVEIRECRKLSKIISFVAVKIIKTKAEMENAKEIKSESKIGEKIK